MMNPCYYTSNHLIAMIDTEDYIISRIVSQNKNVYHSCAMHYKGKWTGSISATIKDNTFTSHSFTTTYDADVFLDIQKIIRIYENNCGRK